MCKLIKSKKVEDKISNIEDGSEGKIHSEIRPPFRKSGMNWWRSTWQDQQLTGTLSRLMSGLLKFRCMFGKLLITNSSFKHRLGTLHSSWFLIRGALKLTLKLKTCSTQTKSVLWLSWLLMEGKCGLADSEL